MSSTRQQISQLCRKYHFVKAGTLLLAAIARKCGSAFYKRLHDLIITWDLNNEHTLSGSNTLDVESIEEQSLLDIARFCRRHKLPSRIYRKVQNYLANGFQGSVVKVEKEMMGFIWWVDDKIPPEKNHPALILFEITLQPGEVYMFDNFLVPEFRGHGNAIKFLAKVKKVLTNRGYHKAIAYVRGDNTPAIWTYKVHGWKTVGRCAQHNICGLISLVNNRIFVRNNRWCRPHCFDYRLIYPRIERSGKD